MANDSQTAYKCKSCGARVNVLLPVNGRDTCPVCHGRYIKTCNQPDGLPGMLATKPAKNGNKKRHSKRRDRYIHAHGNQNSFKNSSGVRLRLKPVRKQLKKK